MLMQHPPCIVAVDPPAAASRGRVVVFPSALQGDGILSIRFLVCLFALLLVRSVPAQTIDGAGATFPYPLYGQWFDAFHAVHHGIEINYRAVGSGAGVSQLLEGAGLFGASDMPMTEEQMAEASAKLKTTVLHFPMVLGAAVPAYNLPGFARQPQIYAGSARRHFPRLRAQMGRPRHCQAQSRRAAALECHRGGPPRRGQRTSYCWTDYFEGRSTMEEPRRQRRLGRLARR